MHAEQTLATEHDVGVEPGHVSAEAMDATRRERRWPVVVPVAAIVTVLVAISFFPDVRHYHDAAAAIRIAASACALWALVLTWTRSKSGLVLAWEPRRQHYVQACAQLSVMLYWGLHWSRVYGWLPFVAAQLVFAYGVDLLVSSTRRGSYTLGFAPLPVVFSINLFLWFREEWFALQLLMVALALLAKEYVVWERSGRVRHIFNPSALPLALASLLLIAAGASSMTYGEEIAATMSEAPYLMAVIFVMAVPGQALFGVTPMTMAAVATTYVCSVVVWTYAGTYIFPDAFFPAAVFLGMHLLFTDPATAPGTFVGRLAFGVAYGVSVVVLYVLMGHWGVPTFYDKILAVPLLNLLVGWIDAIGRSGITGVIERYVRSVDPVRVRTACLALWIAGFVGVASAHVNTPDADGTTALHWAARRNHAWVARAELLVGANASVRNAFGVTPLAVAARDGSAPMVEALVTAGADPNGSVADGVTMLMLAANSGNLQTLDALVTLGADVNARDPILGETALMWAAKSGHATALRALTAAGADPNAEALVSSLISRPDAMPMRRTALTFAIQADSAECVQALLEAGAQTGIVGPGGMTAIEFARQRAGEPVVAALEQFAAR